MNAFLRFDCQDRNIPTAARPPHPREDVCTSFWPFSFFSSSHRYKFMHVMYPSHRSIQASIATLNRPSAPNPTNTTQHNPTQTQLVKTPEGKESPAALAGVPPAAVLIAVAGEHTLRLRYEESIGRYTCVSFNTVRQPGATIAAGHSSVVCLPHGRLKHRSRAAPLSRGGVSITCYTHTPREESPPKLSAC